jgi:hypothetical protein
MLCDYAGVLNFLGLPADTDLPNGRKGKARMKKLHKKVALNKPYHEGDKARPLIRALDMDKILKTAPIPPCLPGSSDNRACLESNVKNGAPKVTFVCVQQAISQ